MTIKKFVLLNEADNVFICCLAVDAGEIVFIDELQLNLTAHIDVGHKIARCDLLAGQKIIRYGVAIGSATNNISKGEHIHMHNMKSDYIASHTRQSVVGD